MTSVAERARGFFNRLEEIVLATLLAFMTCLTFIQVVLRYLFNTGWVWSLEATAYAFAWLVLIGMSYGVRTRTHIAVDIVTRHFPAAWRYYIALLAVFLCLLYSGLMLYGSYLFVEGLHAIGHMARDVPLSKWTLTVIMPAAFLLLSFRFLEAGWHVLKGKDYEVTFGERDASTGIRHVLDDHNKV